MKDLGNLKLIEREEWTACDFKGQPTGHNPKRIVIHHTYSPDTGDYLDLPAKDRFKVVKRIQRYHQHERGWSDIGYHYIIGPDGLVYEGRDVMLVGSHCGGEPPKGVSRKFGNTGSIGVSMIGNFDSENVPAAVLVSLNDLLTYLFERFSIPREEVYGHFEAWAVPPKTCPGKRAVAVIAAGFPRLKEAWNKAYPKNTIL